METFSDEPMDARTSARCFCLIFLLQVVLIGVFPSSAVSQAPGSIASPIQTALFGYKPETPTPSGVPLSVGSAAPTANSMREVNQTTPSQRAIGMAIGAVVGASVTYFVLNSGGSTSLCDQSANQDAAGTKACVGLYTLGGLAGAGLGFVTVGLVTRDNGPQEVNKSLQIGVQLGLGH